MVLLGDVLDDRFLHRSLRGNDRRRIVVVEQQCRLADDGNEELGRLNLAELEGAGSRYWHTVESAKPLVAGTRSSEITYIVSRGRPFVFTLACQRNVKYGPGGV